MINAFKDTFYNTGGDNALFEENYKKVYRAALVTTLDEEMAKDAVQEAFIKAFLKIETLRDKDKFGAWVCSIVVNICRDMIKQKIKQKSLPIYNDDGTLKENLIELMDYEVPDVILEKRRALKS